MRTFLEISLRLTTCYATFPHGSTSDFTGQPAAMMGFSQGCESAVTIARWRCHYNTIRPHSALGYRPPAPETTPPEEVLTTMNQAA